MNTHANLGATSIRSRPNCQTTVLSGRETLRDMKVMSNQDEGGGGVATLWTKTFGRKRQNQLLQVCPQDTKNTDEWKVGAGLF